MSLNGDMLTAGGTDQVWRALADPTRRGILDALVERPRSTTELVELQSGLCRTAVMKHLDVLEAAGLLRVRREGRLRWNRIDPGPIQRIYDRWVSRYVRQKASALSRLKDHVEGGRKGRKL